MMSTRVHPIACMREAMYPMQSSAILREARQLRAVSDRLDSLAEEHPLAAEALIIISGNIRHTAVLLEVLVMLKAGLLSEPGPTDA